MATDGALPDSTLPGPMGRVHLDCFGVIADYVIEQAERGAAGAKSAPRAEGGKGVILAS
jgi:hypothetical protein